MTKYNVDFSKRELIKSIAQATDSATGPDEIHYQFLKHLPDVSIELLLLLLNNLWQSQDFPYGWREATVISVPKPGRDRTDPNNYRPIASASCLCKIMECMINHRTWFLQDNNIITTELEQWNANIAFAQVNLSPLADHKRGNWLFPV